MSKLIVIVGVTGTQASSQSMTLVSSTNPNIQGGSVADTFLNLLGWRVRGTSRNPSSPASEALKTRGVEVVRADFDDPKSLVAAFEGAHAIFVVTDFWQHITNPANHAKAAEAGVDVFKLAYDLEIAQGINAANAAADPSVLKTLERFVYSSLSDASKWSKGKCTGVYHFESKAKVVEHVENSLPNLASKMSIVQIGNYVSNWERSPVFTPQKQDDGSFVFKGIDGAALSPFVVTHKDTGAFVKALVDLPAGMNLMGVSQFLSFSDFAELWGRTLGVKARFQQVSAEEFVSALPEIARRELADTMVYVQEFGWTGGDPTVKNPDELGIEIKTTSVEDYFKSADWSSIL